MKKKFEKAIKELDQYKKKDYQFKEENILGSMCTEPHEIAKKAYINFIETNLGDPKLFPGTRQIEEKYIDFLKKLLHSQNRSYAVNGSGGTESNITAMWIAKNISQKKEIIVPESAHFSFKKIETLMDIKIKPIKINKNFQTDIEDLKEKIDKNTCAVVAIAGSTETGSIDNIKEISNICNEKNVFLHVDAAFGGYIIPFMEKLGYDVNLFDFRLKGVNTISIDAHKMGCSVIPIGSLVVKDKKYLEKISVKTPYISTIKQSNLLGTRPGGAVVAAYAVSKYLGFEGYKKIVKKCLHNTKFLVEKVNDIGLEILTKPETNVVSIKLKNPEKAEEKLAYYRYKVNNMRRLSAIRIVCMPHVTRKGIKRFIPILEKVCKKCGEI